MAKAPALGAGNRRFKSFRSDNVYSSEEEAKMAMCLENKQIAIFFVVHEKYLVHGIKSVGSRKSSQHNKSIK